MNLLTIDDISQMLKLSRVYVRDTLVKKADFPRPSLSISQKNRRWAMADLESWVAKRHTEMMR